MGIYQCIADVLEYPDERLNARLDACEAALGARALAAFRAEAERVGVARLQELYASAFDMDAGCALYAGHHLFGADVRRSIFMACLAAQYREAGFDAAPELPDYLPAILRYVDRAPGAAVGVREELLSEVVLPAARRLAEALDRRQHPYAPVLRALAQMLES